jgi:FMN phosphatase YigB (HAD superfamily)
MWGKGLAYGISARNAVVIGDNPATDGAGAGALATPWVMVGGRSDITFDHLIRNDQAAVAF